MKKSAKTRLSVLFIMAMLLTLTACGKGESNTVPQQDTQAEDLQQNKEPQTEQQTKTQDTNRQSEVSYTMTTPKTIKTNLWELTYDEADGWVYDEDFFTDEESDSEIYLSLPTEDGENCLISVSIGATVESAYNFRDLMNIYGFDQYEYAVLNSYELTNIGGVNCLYYEGELWGSPDLRYFGRLEDAGVTVDVDISGDYESELAKKLISGLRFCLKESGNVDEPWSWEGEPFSADKHNIIIGNHTLRSEWLPITDCLITWESMEHCVAVTDKDAWITEDGILKHYRYDGSSLDFVEDIKSDEEYFRSLSSDEAGTLWLGNPLVSFSSWKDGVKTDSYGELQNIAMHPSGTWGVGYWLFYGKECEKISFSDGQMQSQPLPLTQIHNIRHMAVDENHIYACASAVDEDSHKVFVYDHDGNLQMALAGADGDTLGRLTYIAETVSGFLGLDADMQQVVLWEKDGSYIGAIYADDLFGTTNPWFCDATKLSDDSILVIMTEERADESAMELIAFEISGF